MVRNVIDQATRWLEKGRILERDNIFGEAFKCFEQGLALSPEHPELLCALAGLYHMGYGVAENEERAVALLRKAAEQGHAAAS